MVFPPSSTSKCCVSLIESDEKSDPRPTFHREDRAIENIVWRVSVCTGRRLSLSNACLTRVVAIFWCWGHTYSHHNSGEHTVTHDPTSSTTEQKDTGGMEVVTPLLISMTITIGNKMCKIGTALLLLSSSLHFSAEAVSQNEYYLKKPNVVVEAFVANWCAQQFPEQLPSFSGYSMISVMSEHEKIEPWVGQWCFDQFPDDLSSIGKAEAIKDLYTNHVQLEPFLEAWGRRTLSVAASDVGKQDSLLIDIEPYIADWCVEQYPHELGHLKYRLHENVQAHHVKFEPALARWCFAQFPTDLASLDQASVLQGIETEHELIEDHLIQWTLTTDSAASCLGNGKDQTTAVIVLSSLLSFSLIALFVLSSMVICRRRRPHHDSNSTGEGDADGVTKIEMAAAEIS